MHTLWDRATRRRAGRQMTETWRGNLTVEICGVDYFSGYLSLQYTVTPVTERLMVDSPVRGARCGVAVDDDGGVLAECQCSYRVSTDRSRVAGIVMVGPGVPDASGRVRILFAPLVRAEGLDCEMCEVDVEVVSGSAAVLAVRMH